MLIKTEGIILTKKPLKEKSASIYILTKKLGLIKAEAVGIRQAKSKLLTLVEPGTSGKLALIAESNKFRLITILPYKIPYKIFNLYPYTFLWALRFITLFNFVELSNEFWKLMINLDKYLLKAPRSFPLWFMIKVFDELGVSPNITHCFNCGLKLKTDIYLKDGKLYCQNCSRLAYQKINYNEYKNLLLFFSSPQPLANYPSWLKAIIASHLKRLPL